MHIQGDGPLGVTACIPWCVKSRSNQDLTITVVSSSPLEKELPDSQMLEY